MDKLATQRKVLSEALMRLQEALVLIAEKGEENVIEHRAFRGSVIQRFELVFELSWKYMKGILNEEHGIICQSPKSCLV